MSIFNIFTRKAAAPLAPIVEQRATLANSSRWQASKASLEAIYPPLDPGLPVIDAEQLLHGAEAKLKRLVEIAGGTASEFERLYMTPIRLLASHVHLLPATSSSHYSGPGGLFNMSLDIALMARQAAEGKIFVPESTIEERHRTIGAWRYSAFLAGLLSQLHLPVGQMTVTVADGTQWPKYGVPLLTWLKERSADRYFVIWHEKARVTGAEGASVLSAIVPPEIMNWLSQTDSQIIRDLNVAATREMLAADSILGKVLNGVIGRVKEVEALQHPARFGRLTIGTQFEIHLLNALRELIEEREWKLNDPNGCLFWGSDGLYVAWPRGLEDVTSIFAKRQLKGMPLSSVTLAEMLGQSGVVIGKDTGVWVHDIVVGAEKYVVSAMRFKDPAVLLGHLDFQPVPSPYGKAMVEAQAEQLTLAAARTVDAVNTPRAAGAAAEQPSALVADAPTTQVKVTTSAASPSANKESSAHKVPPALVVSTDSVEVGGDSSPHPGKRVPQDWLKRLKMKDDDDTANALGMVIEQSLAYRGDRVKVLDWGVAICVNWLTNTAGYDLADVLNPLERVGVIARNPQEKGVALVSKVVFSDSPTPRMAFAVKLDFAAKVGMAIDAKV
ncbi:MobH family relaxase [Polaromonas sp. JS666]|uniref:MobH family relaxase n=1 Tax=Polaromonas sp. (strain JS666 / ATCC BAA-500) TaxID=296591 RepID=UPI0000535123|nr:MobH family relaxase [Polaromonas sp. JS666]ABE47326.1 hypothetical protein Bpro_5472 [Polaromonas sp. JS666]